MTQRHHGSDEVKWHMTGSATEVADILMQLAQQLRGGDVNIWKEQRELHLDPVGRIEFSVDAIADDDGYEGLHMKLHWMGRRSDQDALGGNTQVSGEPKPM